MPLSYAADSASAEAYGAEVNLVLTPLLGSPIGAAVGPAPAGISGNAPPDFALSGTQQSFGISLDALGEIVSTGMLEASAAAQLGAEAVAAIGRATDVSVSVIGLIGLGADEIVGTANAFCEGGVVQTSGDTSLSGLSLTLLGLPIISIPANPPPNTIVSVLGISVIANEQIASPGGLSVNALRVQIDNALISLLLGNLDGEIVFGHASASIADCSPDGDGDGVPDDTDVCPTIFDPDQIDTDGDGEGDACDLDDDADGVVDPIDNCPLLPNADQLDTDGDGMGDRCENDDDNDGIEDSGDNCPMVFNPDQADMDGDGTGDACADDTDGDDIPDGEDNCPGVPNPDQADVDNDSIGDACDLVIDIDGDGIPDAEDNCLIVANADQLDTDGDGQGNACDADDDGDGVIDPNDNCPLVANPVQRDSDGDGIGNACSEDDDGDGVADRDDNCPLDPNPDQADSEGDGIGDVCASFIFYDGFELLVEP